METEPVATKSPRSSRKNSRERRGSLTNKDQRVVVTRKKRERSEVMRGTANVVRATVKFSALRSGLGE